MEAENVDNSGGFYFDNFIVYSKHILESTRDILSCTMKTKTESSAPYVTRGD